jgi:hypothetical protein
MELFYCLGCSLIWFRVKTKEQHTHDPLKFICTFNPPCDYLHLSLCLNYENNFQSAAGEFNFCLIKQFSIRKKCSQRDVDQLLMEIHHRTNYQTIGEWRELRILRRELNFHFSNCLSIL